MVATSKCSKMGAAAGQETEDCIQFELSKQGMGPAGAAGAGYQPQDRAQHWAESAEPKRIRNEEYDENSKLKNNDEKCRVSGTVGEASCEATENVQAGMMVVSQVTDTAGQAVVQGVGQGAQMKAMQEGSFSGAYEATATTLDAASTQQYVSGAVSTVATAAMLQRTLAHKKSKNKFVEAAQK
ncbi:MAG: hypothetical protein IT514_16555, partial [Burkholderiales bacterium]|nr:hypothetical protein [Burkholderiales bacterium]